MTCTLGFDSALQIAMVALIVVDCRFLELEGTYVYCILE
jgi:hypothetical protein